MNSRLSRIHFFVLLSFLFSLLLAACSGSSQAAQSVDKLNLVNATLDAQVFTPEAVLTIAPTQIPTSTPTQEIPTATLELTPTHTPFIPTQTLTSTPTHSTSPTETQQSKEPTPLPLSASECPEGCSVPPPDCLIKGNINNEGVKIYHKPGQDYYNQTKISPEKGERWFCTSAEAEANGWRASKR